MFIFGKRPYDYYEKVKHVDSELISIDANVQVYISFEESFVHDFTEQENFSFAIDTKYFAKEHYGMTVPIHTTDKSILKMKHNDLPDVFQKMALESKEFEVKKDELLNKIRRERGELPEYEIYTYLNPVGDIKYNFSRYESERYVGRYNGGMGNYVRRI